MDNGRRWLNQITSIGELKAMRGKTLWFVKCLTLVRVKKSLITSQFEDATSTSYVRAFQWTVGDILYKRETENLLIDAERYPLHTAICIAPFEEVDGRIRLVWLDSYILSEGRNALSGIFRTKNAAEIQLSLIKLTSDVYDDSFNAGDESICSWCGVSAVLKGVMLADFLQEAPSIIEKST